MSHEMRRRDSQEHAAPTVVQGVPDSTWKACTSWDVDASIAERARRRARVRKCDRGDIMVVKC